ncbi:MAG: hypothetical protein AAFO70_04115 [Pseudomonadota bacterium]
MPAFTLPKLDRNLITTAVVAGAVATVGFDLFGQFISPVLKGTVGPYLGAKLAPVGLANQSIAALTGVSGKTISSMGIGYGAHVATGVLAYPLGYILAARPISNAVGKLPWWLTGLAYGAVLFVFALYVMAHLVAGNPPFLGWGGITWVALWGHLLFGLIVAFVHTTRMEAPEATALDGAVGRTDPLSITSGRVAA